MTGTESDPLLFPDGQIVLILVGLIGSGKSTFAQALANEMPEIFVRCSQDDLGDRRRVEQLARDSLRQGYSVIIDRTNFNAIQRNHWITIGREQGVQSWILVFDTPERICAARLQTRIGHPTIKDPEQAMSILARFSSDYRLPDETEGHSRVLYLEPAEQHLLYSQDTLSTILGRLRDSSPIRRSGLSFDVKLMAGAAILSILLVVTVSRRRAA